MTASRRRRSERGDAEVVGLVLIAPVVAIAAVVYGTIRTEANKGIPATP